MVSVYDCAKCAKCLPRHVILSFVDDYIHVRGRYGVTSLIYCLRKAYYRYTLGDRKTLKQLFILSRGKHFHRLFQTKIKDVLHELYLEVKIGNGIRICGFVDTYTHGNLYEYKSVARIPKQPYDSHLAQIYAYAWLAMENGYRVDKLHLMYVSMRDYKIFELDMDKDYVDELSSFLKSRARSLHSSLYYNKLPRAEEGIECDYCSFHDLCKGDVHV